MAELKQINTGRQQSSYKEFTITLQPGQVYTLNNPFNYFRCLEASADFQVAWSANQADTNFRKGLCIKFDDVIPYAMLINPNASAITLSVGVGIGDIDDDRLNLPNTGITMSQTPFTNFTAGSATGATNLTIPDGAQICLVATSGNITVNYSATGISITNMALLEGMTFDTWVAKGGTLAITGTGSFNYSIGSY